VQVADIRNRTFDLDILGRDLDGKGLFRARLTPITINRGDRSRAIELPAMLRERLERYRTSCTKKVA
jgi:acyl-CoA thioesterase FadM